MLFAFLPDPRFLQTKSLLKLHKLEKVNSHEYFSNLTEKFFDYVIAADKKKYFFQEHSSVTDVTETDYILPDILQVVPDTDERESSFTRVHRDFTLYKSLFKQYFSSGKKMEAYEVMDWFNINQSNIPMISYFAKIIHSIPPS